MEQSVSQATAVNHAAELDQILTSYKVQFCQFKICFSKCHRNVIDLMVFELAVSCEKSLTFARNNQVIWWRHEKASAKNFNAVSHNRARPEVLFWI